jgi:DNA-binding CsgD family transcriptional regulator
MPRGWPPPLDLTRPRRVQRAEPRRVKPRIRLRPRSTSQGDPRPAQARAADRAAASPAVPDARAGDRAADRSRGRLPPDPSLVRDLLSLTLGEARIASLIGSGLPPREAAEKLGIAEETARTVLKRVFAKVGVSRQSELAALMTKLVLH